MLSFQIDFPLCDDNGRTLRLVIGSTGTFWSAVIDIIIQDKKMNSKGKTNYVLRMQMSCNKRKSKSFSNEKELRSIPLPNVTETLGLNVLVNQILLWANHSLTSITMLIFCDFRVCVNKVRNMYPAVFYIVVPLNGPHWWDRENRGPWSDQVWHDKDPSWLQARPFTGIHVSMC